MKNNFSLIGFALLLSAVLTLSHALLRSAAAYPTMEFGWILRIGPALFLYGLVFLGYTFLLKYYDVSVLYPVYTALSIIGVFLIGIFYFGEEISPYKIMGLVLLLVGIKLIAI